MKTVDFLPTRYHENDVRRKATAWRYMLLLTFGGAILAATFGQLAVKRSVQVSLDELRSQHREAAAIKETATQLEGELLQTEEIAALYTYLRHPWPRSQLLAQVTRSLPETVVIGELEISRRVDSAGTNTGRPTPPVLDNNTSGASPAKQDLQGLRDANDDKPTVLFITGTASDPVALNHYVAALGLVPLFESAKLTSLEAINVPGEEPSGAVETVERVVSQFEVVIRVRPGYGVSGGPTAPMPAAEQVAQHTARPDVTETQP